MAHSLTRMLSHVVFSTKRDRPFLAGDAGDALNGYLQGIARGREITLIRAGGVADHRHLLLELKPTMPVSDAVRVLKANSSRWFRERVPEFAWQTGYAAFSVSVSAIEEVISYIERQAEHHRKMTFEEELQAFCRRHGVEYDPMVWQE